MRWKDRSFVAGAAVQWLRDKLGVIATAAESETLARQVPDAGGVVVVPAFTGLGTPYWDPQARGTILGLTLGSTKAHVVRATLEAIALQSRDVVQTMQQESGVALQELRADGGAVANALLMQTQADIARHPGGRARSYGDHSARRGVLGRTWRRLLAGRCRRGGAVARCPALRTPNQHRRARNRATPRGCAPSNAHGPGQQISCFRALPRGTHAHDCPASYQDSAA